MAIEFWCAPRPNKRCAASDCVKSAVKRGLCGVHYDRVAKVLTSDFGALGRGLSGGHHALKPGEETYQLRCRFPPTTMRELEAVRAWYGWEHVSVAIAAMVEEGLRRTKSRQLKVAR